MKKLAESANVAIIGLGGAGLSFLVQYVDACIQSGRRDRIVIFDPRATGAGLAYGQAKAAHILNLDSHTMSISHTKPNDFYNWLTANQSRWKKQFPHVKLSDPFPPRSLFGMYLTERFKEYLICARRHGIAVEIVKDEAVALTRVKNNVFRIRTRRGTVRTSHSVLLAVGNMPSDSFLNLATYPGYIHDIWRAKRVPKANTIGVIGTRLTAIDVALDIAETNPSAHLILASRYGKLPKIIGPARPYTLRYLTRNEIQKRLVGSKIPLSALGTLLHKEMEAAEGKPIDWKALLAPHATSASELREEVKLVASQRIRPWQSVLIAFYPLVPWVWSLLSARDRKIFLVHYHSAWLTYLAAFPVENARKILILMESGRLSVRSGLRAVSYDATHREFQLETAEGTEGVQVLVNATGSGHRVSQSALLTDMVRKGLARENAVGGIVTSTVHCGVRGARGIYAIGEMTFGDWFATADLTQASRQAGRAVADILKNHG